MNAALFLANQSNRHRFGTIDAAPVPVPVYTERQLELGALFERQDFGCRTNQIRDLVEVLTEVKLPPASGSDSDDDENFEGHFIEGVFAFISDGQAMLNMYGHSSRRLHNESYDSFYADPTPVTAEAVAALLPDGFEINVDTIIAKLTPVTISEADTLATETYARFGGSRAAIEELTGGRIIRNADFTVGTPVFVVDAEETYFRLNVLYELASKPDDDGDVKLRPIGTSPLLLTGDSSNPYINVRYLRKPTEEELREYIARLSA